ncbi:MAG: bifunctional lytic transglycosylase/C40 family peptidase [Pseudonocardiaceae bacterium]
MSIKIGGAALGTIVVLTVLIAALVQAALTTLVGTGPTQPTQAALADIPLGYLTLYRHAATVCPGLDWTILAAIGKIETNHGRLDAPGVHTGENSAGAGGPMQFLQPTFDTVITRHTIPTGGASPPSRYDPHDAIHAAAYYLCDSGARDGHNLHQAIFTYNHADWYVRKVLDQATLYAQAATVGTGDCTTIQTTNTTAFTAINYACGQRGLPYVWGGNGRADGGFDCSGLTTAAYAAAGITLPRTADAQYRTGPHVPTGQPLVPGDLVFYGSPANIHHVGLYLGAGLMIDAPDFGQVVKIEPYHHPRDDYAGATRPANRLRL